MTLDLSTEETEINNHKDPEEMRFATDNSLQERLRRIQTGKDSSNWLTEDLPTIPGTIARQLKAKEPEKTGVPNVSGAPADHQKVETMMGPLADVYRNEAVKARKGVDFGDIDVKSEDVQGRLRNFAGNSILHARELLNADESRTEGAGSKAFTFAQIQALRLNEERNKSLYKEQDLNKRRAIVGSTRPFEWTPKFIESTFNLVRQLVKSSGPLSGKYKDAKNPEDRDKGRGDKRGLHAGQLGADIPLSKDEDGLNVIRDIPEPVYKKNGEETTASIKKRQEWREKIASLDDEKVGKVMNMFGSSSTARSRLIWRLFLEQGGLEGLTQLPLDLLNTELEHTVPFQGEGEDIPQPQDPKNITEEEWEKMYEHALSRDHIDNFMLISKSVNNAKSNLDMDNFYRRRVAPLYKLTQNDFQVAEEETEAVNTKTNDFIGTLMPLMFDENGEIRDDANIEEFFSKIMGFSSVIEEHQAKVQELYPKLDGASTLMTGLSELKKAGFEGFPELLSKGKGFDSNTEEQQQYRDDYFDRIEQLKTFMGGRDFDELIQNLKQKDGETDRKFSSRRAKIYQQLETLQERLGVMGLSGDDYERSQWATKRASSLSFEDSKTRILKEIISRLGLNHTWSRKGTEKSPGDRGGIGALGSKGNNEIVEGFLKAMLTGDNIRKPEMIKKFKNIWRLAYKNGVETDEAGTSQFIDTLKKISNNPDNLPDDIDELLKTLKYPNKDPQQMNFETLKFDVDTRLWI